MGNLSSSQNTGPCLTYAHCNQFGAYSQSCQSNVELSQEIPPNSWNNLRGISQYDQQAFLQSPQSSVQIHGWSLDSYNDPQGLSQFDQRTNSQSSQNVCEDLQYVFPNPCKTFQGCTLREPVEANQSPKSCSRIGSTGSHGRVGLLHSPQRHGPVFQCFEPGCPAAPGGSKHKVFKRRYELERHQKKHGSRMNCPAVNCKKQEYRQDKLKDHVRCGHRDEDTIFQCPVTECGMFLVRADMLNHFDWFHQNVDEEYRPIMAAFI